MAHRGLTAGIVLAGLLTGGSAWAGAPGTFNAAFAPASVALGGTSTLTYTMTAADMHRRLSFETNLPTGLVVAAPNGAFTDCAAPTAPAGLTPTVTAVPGSSTILFEDGNTTIPDGPVWRCSVSVNVTGSTTGLMSLPDTYLYDDGSSTFLKVAPTLTVTAAAAAPASIPTLSEWALILMVLALGGSAFNALRRQRR